MPSHDVQKLSIGEPFAFAPDKVVFTLKMQSLSNPLPVETEWPITFDIAGVNYTVKLTTEAADGATAATPLFQVFKTSDGSLLAATADPASNYTSDGAITIVVPRSLLGNPAVGSQLNHFLTRIADAATITPDNMPNNLVPAGSYTIVGNAFCAPNTAPVASLKAYPVNQPNQPPSGAPPFAVTLDGSGSSDPDAGDTIASYTFDFGDGSASVTQSGPKVDHIYNTGGQFVASLKVTDSRGKASNNTAVVDISVNTPPTAALVANPTSGFAPLSVSFDASGSSDPDSGDTIASYTFNFGDGNSVTQSTATTSHQYANPGTFTASLTVTDSRGKASTNSATQTITVNGRPDLVVSALAANPSQPKQGSTVTLTATVKNQGQANAGASKTEFLLDGKTVLGTVNTAALAPGATVQVSANWTKVKKGQHTIKATADRNNAVAESDENNNATSITVTVK